MCQSLTFLEVCDGGRNHGRWRSGRGSALIHCNLRETVRAKRSSLFSSFFIGACLAVSVIQASASEFNGSIKGSVDGHKIDVKAACSPDKKPWDWLRALSDPAHRPESLRDLTGDGIAIMASTSRSAGRATISMKVGETAYKFSGGKRNTTLDDSGFKVAGKFDRTEGEGKDRKVVSTYQVDLTVACQGI